RDYERDFSARRESALRRRSGMSMVLDEVGLGYGPAELDQFYLFIRIQISLKPMGKIPQLHVAMYHYVRNLPRTRFPQIKGMILDDFSRQVASLCEEFEMATL